MRLEVRGVIKLGFKIHTRLHNSQLDTSINVHVAIPHENLKERAPYLDLNRRVAFFVPLNISDTPVVTRDPQSKALQAGAAATTVRVCAKQMDWLLLHLPSALAGERTRQPRCPPPKLPMPVPIPQVLVFVRCVDFGYRAWSRPSAVAALPLPL